jgi:hypothetical protein
MSRAHARPWIRLMPPADQRDAGDDPGGAGVRRRGGRMSAAPRDNPAPPGAYEVGCRPPAHLPPGAARRSAAC